MKFLKASADIVNVRKRVANDKEISIKFANEKFARELLETLDNFENMLSIEMSTEVRNGTELIYKGLLDTLKRNNVVECEIEKFDPDFHQAMSTMNTDDKPNTILKVLRKGYLIEDRLLRPAMVVVSK